MNIYYIVRQPYEWDYDEFDSAVVFAENEEGAKALSLWPVDTRVFLLGKAVDDRSEVVEFNRPHAYLNNEEHVVSASFNAG